MALATLSWQASYARPAACRQQRCWHCTSALVAWGAGSRTALGAFLLMPPYYPHPLLPMLLQDCSELATRTGLPLDTILTFARQSRRAAARLGSLTSGAGALAAALAAQPLERKRLLQRQYYERQRIRKLQQTAGVPLPEPQGRVRGAARSGGVGTQRVAAGRKGAQQRVVAEEPEESSSDEEEEEEEEEEEVGEPELLKADRRMLMPLMQPTYLVSCHVFARVVGGLVMLFGRRTRFEPCQWRSSAALSPASHPPTLPPPHPHSTQDYQRKKRWHKSEDRTLLQAWSM